MNMLTDAIPLKWSVRTFGVGLTVIYHPCVISQGLQRTLESIALQRGAIVVGPVQCENAYFHMRYISFLSLYFVSLLSNPRNGFAIL